jgi:ANTAR domain-containing protein
VEQAKLELSARYGLLLDEAFELLSGLARSQRRSVEEFAESVVRSGGRLDARAARRTAFVTKALDARSPRSAPRAIATPGTRLASTDHSER